MGEVFIGRGRDEGMECDSLTRPSLLISSRDAPASTKTLIISICLSNLPSLVAPLLTLAAAYINAVAPAVPTSGLLTSAPAFTSARTTSMCPFATARWMGRVPARRAGASTAAPAWWWGTWWRWW